MTDVFRYSPTATATSAEGCSNHSVSVSYNYVTVTQSREVCPNSVGPAVIRDDYFSSIWRGAEGDDRVWVATATVNVAKVKDGQASGFQYKVYVKA